MRRKDLIIKNVNNKLKNKRCDKLLMSQDMSNMMMGDMAENPPSPEELKVRSSAIFLLSL
jgi:hypothetical protein